VEEVLLALRLPKSPLAAGKERTGERASLECRGRLLRQSERVLVRAWIRAEAVGKERKGRQRAELFGEKSVRLWECLEVMVEGGAVVAGDEKVPGLTE